MEGISSLLSETKISIAALARREGVSLPTPWRWCVKGIGGRRLESFMLGGRRYTTEEAYRRWIHGMTSDHDGACDQPAMPSPTTKQREAAVSADERELIEQGA
ncbi:MAG: DUF1580 domain-containing protein [Pirellulales bacterium]